MKKYWGTSIKSCPNPELQTSMFLATPQIQSEDVLQNWFFPKMKSFYLKRNYSHHLLQCGKQQNLQEQNSLQRWHKLHEVNFSQLVSCKVSIIGFKSIDIIRTPTIVPCQTESRCSSWDDSQVVCQSLLGYIHLLHHPIQAQTHLFLNCNRRL